MVTLALPPTIPLLKLASNVVTSLALCLQEEACEPWLSRHLSSQLVLVWLEHSTALHTAYVSLAQ